MSRNMGQRTARDAGHRVDSGLHESPGLPIRSICPACGKRKRSGESHPRCSRILQQRYWAGRE